jgi:hypothetical protein
MVASYSAFRRFLAFFDGVDCTIKRFSGIDSMGKADRDTKSSRYPSFGATPSESL